MLPAFLLNITKPSYNYEKIINLLKIACMKCYTLLLILSIITTFSFAQTRVKESVYSTSLKDSVTYDVWLPDNYNAQQTYPVIYCFNYGMVNARFIASQLKYFEDCSYLIPKSIIINIYADMDRIGYNYITGKLTPIGESFVNCIKKEIIPTVDKKYSTSFFKTYMGHSYAASYANNLFINHPEIFNAYILFAPEKTEINNASFNISAGLKEYYSKKQVFYYAAVGQFDMDRRRNYAKETEAKLKQLNNPGMVIKYDSIPNKDHATVVSDALQPALEHVYSLYDPAYKIDTTVNAYSNLQLASKRISDTYGIHKYEPRRNYYAPFAQLAIQKNDTASLLKILKYYSSPNLKGYDLVSFARFCVNVGLQKQSKMYLEQALDQINKKEKNERWATATIANCYDAFVTEIYKSDTTSAKGYLQKLKLLIEANHTKYPALADYYFSCGTFGVDNKCNLNESLTFLNSYLKERENLTDAIHASYDRIYYYIGKCNYLLKKNLLAKQNLEKAIQINSANKAAQELLKQVSSENH